MSNTLQIAEVTRLLARATALLAECVASSPAANDTAPEPAPVPPGAAPAVAVSLPEYLTTAQAAALLGVSTKGLEAMRARGAGPRFVRIGKGVRYRACDLPGAKGGAL